MSTKIVFYAKLTSEKKQRCARCATGSSLSNYMAIKICIARLSVWNALNDKAYPTNRAKISLKLSTLYYYTHTI